MADPVRRLTEEEFYSLYPEKRPRNSRNSGQTQQSLTTDLSNNDPLRQGGGVNTSRTQDLSRFVTAQGERSRNNQGERPAPAPVPGLPDPQERLPGGVVSARSARVFSAVPRPTEETRENPRLPESRRGLAPLVSGEFQSVRLKDWQMGSDRARGEGQWQPTMARDAQALAERSAANAGINPGTPRGLDAKPLRQRQNGAEVFTGDDVWRMYLRGLENERAQTGETADNQLRFLNQAGALSLAARNLSDTAQDPAARGLRLGVAMEILRNVAAKATGEGFRSPLALKDVVEASKDVRKSPPRPNEYGDPAEIDPQAGRSFDIAAYGPTDLPFVDSKGRISAGRIYAGDIAGVIDDDPDNTATFKQTKDVPWGRSVREAADYTRTPLIGAPDLQRASDGGRYRLATDQEKAASAGTGGKTTLHGYLRQGDREVEIYGPFGRDQDYFRVGRPFNRDSEGFRELLRSGRTIETQPDGSAASGWVTAVFPAPAGQLQSRASTQSPRALAQLANNTGRSFELELDDGRTVQVGPADFERYASRIAEGLSSGEWGVGEGRVIQGGKLPRFYIRGESGRELLVPIQTPNDQYPVLFKTANEGTRDYAGPAFLHPDYRVRMKAEEWAQGQPGMPVSLSEIVGELSKGGFMENAPIANTHEAAFRTRVAVVQRMLQAGSSEPEINAVLAAMNRTPAETQIARQSVISRLGLGREVDVQALDFPSGATLQPDLPGDEIAQQLMEEAAAQEARLRAANPTGYGYAAFGDDYRSGGDEIEGGMPSDRMLDDLEAEVASRARGGQVAEGPLRTEGVEDRLARLAMARLNNAGLSTEGNVRRDLSSQARLVADVANRSSQSLAEKIAAVRALTGGEPRSVGAGGPRQLSIPGWRAPAYSAESAGWPFAATGPRRPQSTQDGRVLEPASYRQMRLPLSAEPQSMSWDQPVTRREAAIYAELQERQRRESADRASAQLQASNRPNQVAVNTARVSQFNAPEPVNPGTAEAANMNIPTGQGTIPGMSQDARDYTVPANDRLSALTRMMAAQPRPGGSGEAGLTSGGFPSWPVGQSSVQTALDFRPPSRPVSAQELVELRRRIPFAWGPR